MVPRVLSLHWRNFVLVLSLERVTGIEPAWLNVGNRGRYPIVLLKRSLAGGRLAAEPVGRPKKVKDKLLI
jgi:hypothetical protein